MTAVMQYFLIHLKAYSVIGTQSWAGATLKHFIFKKQQSSIYHPF